MSLSTWARALKKAAEAGHELHNDPSFMGSVQRHTCRLCGGALMLAQAGHVYGSVATHQGRCPSAPKE